MWLEPLVVTAVYYGKNFRNCDGKMPIHSILYRHVRVHHQYSYKPTMH